MSGESYVIYDCDIGTDDAWGLLMLIRGEEMHKRNKIPSFATAETSITHTIPGKVQNYKILGITCVHGNTTVDHVVQNALRVLDAADRCDLPVFKGCATPILPPTVERKSFFHGKDGFGDLSYDKDVNIGDISEQHAVNAMYSFVCQYPNKVDFLLVGPLTNFAVCINMYGDAFLDKVRNVYIMGGNYRGKGNITKSAEFNFMMDPEAAHIVLEKIKKPLVILPWETCIDNHVGLTMKWRFDVLGSVASKPIELMNRVERATFGPKQFLNWVVCDAMLVAAYIFPHIAIGSSRPYHATVELTGTHTRGQMVLDHLRHKEDNTVVILDIQKSYRKIIAWTAGLEETEEIFDNDFN